MSSKISCTVTWFSMRARRYSTSANKNVAFLGLGNMGQHMAANLVKKGYQVRGYDSSEDTLQSVGALGVEPFSSIKECVQNVGYVVTALPNNDIVRKVYLAEDGVVNNANKGTLLIDSSTVEPTVSQEVSEAAKRKELSFIDAPMSGGVMGARNGTLAFMVGGSERDFRRSEAILLSMGAGRVHCGEVGSGEVAKLCNNLLMANNMMATAECLNLGVKMGLDPKALLEVINSSSGRSWCSEIYCPVPGLVPTAPSSGGYSGGFKTDLLVKDLTLASNIVASSKTPTPLGALSTQFYKLVQTKGLGEKDFSYIYQFIKE